MKMTAVLEKPTVAEVHAVLAAHEALIVHFSGVPKGSGLERGHLYPDDLRYVIAGNSMGGLACSTVKPGDVFAGFQRNATGCIGLILDLTSPASLVAVSATDCGSIEGPNGIRMVLNERSISVADVEASIFNRPLGHYNEWVVRDFKVIGVLAVPPFEISDRGGLELPPDVPAHLVDVENEIGPVSTNLDAVAATFSSLPIYTFGFQRLFRLAPHADLYR
jgi:hypothetical protein